MFGEKKELVEPKHIAFICDGNRRWAVARKIDKMLGHKAGAQALKDMVKTLEKYPGIEYASFFCFSTENWNREKYEVDYLMDIAYTFLSESEKSLVERNVKLVSMGDVNRLPEKLRNLIVKVMDETKDNTGLVVNLALNYGGRDDIAHAAKIVAENGEEMTIENISKHLYSYPSPDIDLLVRTSGEMRISNFMLFQLAYAEFYFTKTCWPGFNKKELDKAVKVFSKRKRRFGGGK